MFKFILKIFGTIIVAMVALFLLLWLLRLFQLLIGLVFGILILAGMVYLISLLFKIGTKSETKSVSYKVCDYKQPMVALFAAEPSVKELINAQNMSHITEWALNGSIVEVDNNTQVIVLDDSRQKEAVHVRVANGQFSGREGWVCRSVLLKSDQKLLGG